MSHFTVLIRVVSLSRKAVSAARLVFRWLGAIVLCAFTAAAVNAAAALETGSPVEVRVVPDKADWTYELGQPVRFRVELLREGHPLSKGEIRYTVGPEMMPAEEKSATVGPEGLLIEAPPLTAPGFIRCSVQLAEGERRYRGLATAAIAPHAIVPTQTEPDDFDAFWAAGKAELARTPMSARMTLMPEATTAAIDVYHVSLATVDARGQSTTGESTRVYGILCEPKTPARCAAVLRLPGAGVYPIGGDKILANEGMITLEIGVHGIPLNLSPEAYAQLRAGALAGYPAFNLDDPDRYYYRRVHLSCLRALDFLASRPKFDGRNLFVIGGSQGGQLAVAAAALDSRVRACAAFYPAYSDVTGYLHGRAGGWPHFLRPDPATGAANPHATEAKQRTMRYYDTVNFARRLRVPTLFAWGFNDEVCPPTSLYAVANVTRAPKQLVVARAAGHSPTPEQEAIARAWLRSQVDAPAAKLEAEESAPLSAIAGSARPLTVGEVTTELARRYPPHNPSATIDTLKAGDPKEPLRGVVVTFSATLSVLQEAVKHGANLIITHEPAFYSHRDETDWLQADPVYEAKRRFIADHRLAVWRLHDGMHARRPDEILAGMVTRLGWRLPEPSARPNVFTPPAMTVRELAELCKKQLGIERVRVAGELDRAVGRVGLMPGAAGGRLQIRLFQESDVDVVICGESPEWETCEYVRDATSAGRPMALMVLGHAKSEEAGMSRLAEALREFLPPGVPVHYVDSADPFRSI